MPLSSTILHLPNGQTVTVSPSFGGLTFKANDLHIHHNVFPPGWTIILHSEDDGEDHENHGTEQTAKQQQQHHHHHHIHRYQKPTLHHDYLYISSISNPSSNDFRPPTSPSRQIAMMLWATLWWYFHQPRPEYQLATSAAASTPPDGRPKGDWIIHIKREGIFKGRQLLPKLERMGLVSCEDSCVGADPEDGAGRDSGVGFEKCFVSQRAFWALDARIFLFTMMPANPSPYPSFSPSNSRPSSPNRTPPLAMTARTEEPPNPIAWRSSTPPGPFHSSSHLPTFYPPPPLQYTFTNGLRHPVRPKPARQGETIYTRYIPSLEQYLSFRIASLSSRPVVYRGPTSHTSPFDLAAQHALNRDALRPAQQHLSDSTVPTIRRPADPTATSNGSDTLNMTDAQLLHKWMNDDRVAASWGEKGPQSHQEAFLKKGLESRHSFPVIGCFDGKPFGYFEVYWVKEDHLAPLVGSECAEWDRGLHVLVGEQEFRGGHRVKVWLSALVHYCFLADMRTTTVFMEPRVDNEKLRAYCEEIGFFKEREIAFPHKQSNLMKIRRDAWLAPSLDPLVIPLSGEDVTAVLAGQCCVHPRHWELFLAINNLTSFGPLPIDYAIHGSAVMKLQAVFLLLTTAADVAAAGRPWGLSENAQRNSDQLCLTKMRAGNGRGRPAALPTRQSTSTKTVTEVVTASQSAQFQNTIATSIPLTAATTLRLFAEEYPQDCTFTSTVTINPTQTLYTGYLETTSQIFTNNRQKLRVFNHNVGSFGGFRHNFGHGMDMSRQRPYLVDCIVHETITSTQIIAQSTTLAADGVQSSQLPRPSSNCTTTIGSVTATTTQHIKCAPTNLISEIDGHGINAVAGQDTFALAPANDASACCQLCVDTADCAASEADVLAGNCFLWFTTGTNNTCGLSLVYSDGGRSNEPGSGFILQTGCGSVEAAASP